MNETPHTTDQTPEETGEAEWPSIEEQEAYWSLRDEGRSDGQGESYAERQT